MVRRLDIKDQDWVSIPTVAGAPEQVHVFSDVEILAVNTALAARRALLVRGEPGTGKTQLAKAVAIALRRGFIPFTVDSRTEARDLLWYFDAAARLAEAQIQGVLIASGASRDDVRAALDIKHFIQPRPLWWGFNWRTAEEQTSTAKICGPSQPLGCDPGNGMVVLIDEIDKAESDVPNGLLEALGAGEFTPQGLGEAVTIAGEPPLVIVTTNEERALPDAFLRRCIVLYLRLPEQEDKLIAHLVARGERHFPQVARDPVLLKAARLVAQDRARALRENWLPLPGQAEFIDLVRAVQEFASEPAEQEAALESIRDFVLLKHKDAAAAAQAAKDAAAAVQAATTP